MQAYIQGDWVAAPVSGNRVDEAIKQHYEAMLAHTAEHGIVNMATWHTLPNEPREDGVDAVRNCREIDQIDVVITYLQRVDPPKKHWGSLSLIGYALGARKRCVVLAPRDCIVWKHHLVHHPMIVRIEYTDHADALDQLSAYIAQQTTLPPTKRANRTQLIR